MPRIAAALLVLFCLVTTTAAQETAVHGAAPETRWAGEWQTYWRTGQALLTLQVEGNVVTGTYRPGDGVIEGIAEGALLRGTWTEPGATGGVVFALSQDGQTLTGRYDNGEYWNGQRVSGRSGAQEALIRADSPRATLRSVLIAMNSAIYDSDLRALQNFEDLVVFAGETTSSGDRARRRTLMWQILDMSTLRILDVPAGISEAAGDTAQFEVGPAGTSVAVPLLFRLGEDRRWRLVLPPLDTLREQRGQLLEALGVDSYEAARRARANSPRAVMREFLVGTATWDDGGRERAVAVMDLSFLPQRLRAHEAAIIADYLRRIIDRVGYVIWQEIPDDPAQVVPYVHYKHAAGSVVVEQLPGVDDAPGLWVLSEETLRDAPGLLAAIQALPLAQGIADPQPLSRYFQLRERIRSTAPELLEQRGALENWQWVGLGLAILGVALGGGLMALVLGLPGRTSLPGRLAVPVAVFASAVVLTLAVDWLGLAQAGVAWAGRVTGVLVTLAGAALAYRVADLIGARLLSAAEKTASYVDEIAASLGRGLVKLLIVVAAIFVAADVAGLPYEGVLTGLGVGGIALAFAARDTVSNMLGGAILMTDRPFARGDLIEVDGHMATVESVGLRSTKLRTLDDTLLHVPNSHLSDRSIANWGKRRKRKVQLLIGLTYDTPRETLDRFVTRLREVLLAQPGVDDEAAYVGVKAFGASSIDIELYGFFKVFTYDAQVDAQHALMLDIVSLAQEMGVDFAFPTRTLHIAAAEAPPALRPVPDAPDAGAA